MNEQTSTNVSVVSGRLKLLPAESTGQNIHAAPAANQFIVTQLDNLGAGVYLRLPIPVYVYWSDEMACFVATDSVVQWHGQGATERDALDDLAIGLSEEYADLKAHEHALSPGLARRLGKLSTYIVYAG